MQLRSFLQSRKSHLLDTKQRLRVEKNICLFIIRCSVIAQNKQFVDGLRFCG